MTNKDSDINYDSNSNGPVVTYKLITDDNETVAGHPYLAMKIDDSRWVPVQRVFEVVQKRAEMSFDREGPYRAKIAGAK